MSNAGWNMNLSDDGAFMRLLGIAALVGFFARLPFWKHDAKKPDGSPNPKADRISFWKAAQDATYVPALFFVALIVGFQMPAYRAATLTAVVLMCIFGSAFLIGVGGAIKDRLAERIASWIPKKGG